MTRTERRRMKADAEYDRRRRIAENAEPGRRLIARAALVHAMTARLEAENAEARRNGGR